MTTFFWYIIKVIIVSGIFYGYYHIALKEKTFLIWNRFYLLSAVFLSVVLPWISIPLETASLQGSTTRLIHQFTFQEEIVVMAGPMETSSNWMYLVHIIYLIISAALLLLFLLKVIRIFQIDQKYPRSKIGGVHFINTNLPETPFSFFNTIYWNNEIDPASPSGKNIFRHELAHVKDRHSWDVTGLNLATAMFWINPFFWIIKKELGTIHEFIADRRALEWSDTESFVKMILSSVYGTTHLSITNNFFNTSIKRRLNMIKKNRNKNSGIWGRIITLPVAMLVFFGVSCSTNNEKDIQQVERMSPPTIVKDTPEEESGETAMIHPREAAENSDTEEKIYVKVEKEATFPGGTNAWREYIINAIQASLDSFTEKDYGTAVIKFVVDKNGNVSDVSAQTMKGTLLASISEKAIKNGPKWIPAMADGHNVNAYRLQPVTLKNPDAGK